MKSKILKNKKIILSLTIFLVCSILFMENSYAASITLDSGEAGAKFGPIEVLFLMLVLTLGPSIIIMMTSFTRIVIVMSFLRNALGTQQSPPNQVMIGLSLFLTMFVMAPTFDTINEVAYQPYVAGEIQQDEAIEKGVVPLKTFMLKQTQKKDLNLFLSISGKDLAETDELSTEEKISNLGLDVIVPAFITSELKRAFLMGFLLFIPFLVIDIVVSSTLMSMGMVMLPPAMIALPFKIMMFVLVDGWGLLFKTLVESFR